MYESLLKVAFDLPRPALRPQWTRSSGKPADYIAGELLKANLNCRIPPSPIAEVSPMKRLFILILALSIYSVAPVYAQDQTAPQPAQKPTDEEVTKQKAELEKNAYRLLEQVVDEAQSSLRLPENRVRVQIVA